MTEEQDREHARRIDLAVLKAELAVCIDIHDMLAAPWGDANDVKGHLTSRKNRLRRKIKEAERRELL